MATSASASSSRAVRPGCCSARVFAEVGGLPAARSPARVRRARRASHSACSRSGRAPSRSAISAARRICAAAVGRSPSAASSLGRSDEGAAELVRVPDLFPGRDRFVASFAGHGSGGTVGLRGEAQRKRVQQWAGGQGISAARRWSSSSSLGAPAAAPGPGPDDQHRPGEPVRPFQVELGWASKSPARPRPRAPGRAAALPPAGGATMDPPGA